MLRDSRKVFVARVCAKTSKSPSSAVSVVGNHIRGLTTTSLWPRNVASRAIHRLGSREQYPDQSRRSYCVMMASQASNNSASPGASEFEMRRAELVGQIGDVSD